jgi:hypothetical protein
MLHLPYKGDIFNFNKEDIDMLHKCTVAMVPFVSGPAIEPVKERKSRHKGMNDAIKAKNKEIIRANQAAVKARRRKLSKRRKQKKPPRRKRNEKLLRRKIRKKP